MQAFFFKETRIYSLSSLPRRINLEFTFGKSLASADLKRIYPSATSEEAERRLMEFGRSFILSGNQHSLMVI